MLFLIRRQSLNGLSANPTSINGQSANDMAMNDEALPGRMFRNRIFDLMVEQELQCKRILEQIGQAGAVVAGLWKIMTEHGETNGSMPHVYDTESTQETPGRKQRLMLLPLEAIRDADSHRNPAPSALDEVTLCR